VIVSGKLRVAVAGDSGDGEDLSARTVKDTALERLLAAVALRPEIVHLEHDSSRGLLSAPAAPPSSRPTIRGRERLRSGVGGRHRPDRAPGPKKVTRSATAFTIVQRGEMG